MGKHNPAFDKYIEKSADFAKPILIKLRSLFHEHAPECDEELKWGHLAYCYKGIVAGMAAFKQHCSFGFWRHKLLDDPKGYLSGEGEGMGGGRWTSVANIPPDNVMKKFIREAIAIHEAGEMPKVTRRERKPVSLKPPADLAAAFKKNKKALATWETFSPSHKREYLEWITGAKQEETRVKRLKTAIEWMNAGKPHNWKYMEKYRAKKKAKK